MTDIDEAIEIFEDGLGKWEAYMAAYDDYRSDEDELSDHLRIAEAGLQQRPDNLSDKLQVENLRKQVSEMPNRQGQLAVQRTNLPNLQKDLDYVISLALKMPNLDLRTMPHLAAFDQEDLNLFEPNDNTIAQAREAVKEIRQLIVIQKDT